MQQNRLKSKTMWMGLFSGVWMALEALGLPQKWGLERTAVFNLLDAIAFLFIQFGILNNPTDKENF